MSSTSLVIRRFVQPFAIPSLLVGLVWAAMALPLAAEVTITSVDGKLRVEIDGQMFTELVYKESPRPYLYPVYGPGGQMMTRNFPMKKGVPGEAKDHPHHRSIWHGHQGVNGNDLWTEGRPHNGTIVHDELLLVKADKDVGVIRARNKWLDGKKEIQCTDETTLRFYGNADVRMLDYEVTIIASHGKLVLSDQKDAFVAMRTHPALRIRPVGNAKPTGHAINSAGDRDKALWGKSAKWLDYWGPIDGQVVGIAMFDHPTNPRHPTHWHARDYGLVTANCFGLHHFSHGKLPRNAGNFVLNEGKSVRFRYRFYFHKGSADQANIPAQYQAYVEQVK